MAAFGNVLNLEIDKNGKVIVNSINCSYTTLEDLENNLLLFSTGITHSAVDIISDQKKNLETDEEKMNQMHLIREIGDEIKLALERGDTSKIGKWLNVHWEAKRKFSKKMSSNKIDLFYELGIKNGAIGGKLVGAGGGGFLMFYCEENKSKLRGAMEKSGLKEVPFRFDREGCKIIYNGK
jgi:D-glycero-alpha-D-manno-heptose-7-phosphate kinase